MTTRRKVIGIFIIILVLFVTIGGVIMWEMGRTTDYLKKDVPNAITQLSDASYLDNIAQLIRYDDEVLTQSARNYAFTGDPKWKERYLEFVPKLDLRINQALEKGDDQDKQFFSDINQSNLALVEMETKSMQMVDDGKKTEAQQILDSPDYAAQKEIYKTGLDKFLAKQGTAADQASSISTDILNNTNVKTQKMIKLSAYLLGSFILLAFILLGILYLIIFYSLIRPLNTLKEATQRISEGDLSQKLDIKSSDEIGQLSGSFNQMITDLKESRENIEKKVSERTEELEKLNKFMVGRELKMVELKEKLKKSENKK